MNISAWSIRNPVPSVLLFVLLTVCGLLAFSKLQVQNFPDMDLPTIKISASLEGAAPTQLETEVARKIEDKLASLSLLDHITTTITDGSVSISVSFKLEKNSETALNEVRNAVDSAKSDLPSEMESPTVSKVTVQSSVLVTYAVRSKDLDETELSWFVDNDMTKALLSVGGVGEVDRLGGVDREVHIDLDPNLMTSFGITASDISSRVKSVQSDKSGGRGEIGRVARVHELERLRSVVDRDVVRRAFTQVFTEQHHRSEAAHVRQPPRVHGQWAVDHSVDAVAGISGGGTQLVVVAAPGLVGEDGVAVSFACHDHGVRQRPQVRFVDPRHGQRDDVAAAAL